VRHLSSFVDIKDAALKGTAQQKSEPATMIAIETGSSDG
jgi:hypothetical protein